MKKLKLLPVVLALLALGMTACNNAASGGESSGQGGGGGGGGNQSSEVQPDSPIKSLVATVENLELKRGEATSVTAYYKLTGYKTLSSKEKKVTITSSNPEAVSITGNIMKGLIADGRSTITITSQADTTKSCSFDVLVKDIFFNRTYSEINGGDDLEKELPADGGIISTTGGMSDMLIFNQDPSTSFMVTTKIRVDRVSDGELWPKFGLVFKMVDANDDLSTSYMIFFLDGPMNRVNNGAASWTDFGYCEIAGGVFGWDSNPAYARHKEDAFIKNTPIGYDEFFTMTAVAEGSTVHMFLGYGEGDAAKEVYMFSVEFLSDLYSTGVGGFIPGFFQFNSVVTYKEYSYSTDAAAVAAQMEGVTPRFATYDHGETEGERYYEE